MRRSSRYGAPVKRTRQRQRAVDAALACHLGQLRLGLRPVVDDERFFEQRAGKFHEGLVIGMHEIAVARRVAGEGEGEAMRVALAQALGAAVCAPLERVDAGHEALKRAKTRDELIDLRLAGAWLETEQHDMSEFCRIHGSQLLARNVAALAERGCHRAPGFPSIGHAEPTQSATASAASS